MPNTAIPASALPTREPADLEREALDEFEYQLRQLLGTGSGLRPFTCDGNPLTCQVFVVGFNATTALDVDFWQHWRSGYGFLADKFCEEYARARPPKQGGKLVGTRRSIGWLQDEVAPLRCLVTNLYATPSKRKVDLSPAARGTQVLDFLLDVIKPEFVVPHGVEAKAYFQERTFSGYCFPAERHLRSTSEAAVRALGQRILRFHLGTAGT